MKIFEFGDLVNEKGPEVGYKRTNKGSSRGGGDTGVSAIYRGQEKGAMQ